jgi:hypothetical protein
MMRLRIVGCSAVFSAVIVLAAAAPAQETSPSREEARSWLTTHTLGFARPQDRLDSFKAKASRAFVASDFDGGGVSRSDYEMAGQLQVAAARASRIRQWAELDLDGDGTVTRAEAERAKLPQTMRTLRPHGITVEPTRDQLAALLDKLLADAFSDDLDGNGTITLTEVLDAQRARQARQVLSQAGRLLVPLALDRDGDGVVGAGEFDASVGEVFATIDADGNGVLDQAEIDTARRGQRSRPAPDAANGSRRQN